MTNFEDKVLLRRYRYSLKNLLPVASALMLVSCGGGDGISDYGSNNNNNSNGRNSTLSTEEGKLGETIAQVVLLSKHLPSSDEKSLELVFKYWKDDSSVTATTKQQIILSTTVKNVDSSNGSKSNAGPLTLNGSGLFLYKVEGAVLYDGATPILPLSTKTGADLILHLGIAGEKGITFEISLTGDDKVIATGRLPGDDASLATVLEDVKGVSTETVDGSMERVDSGFKIVFKDSLAIDSARVENIWFAGGKKGDIKNWSAIFEDSTTLYLQAVGEGAFTSDLTRLEFAVGDSTYAIDANTDLSSRDNLGDDLLLQGLSGLSTDSLI